MCVLMLMLVGCNYGDNAHENNDFGTLDTRNNNNEIGDDAWLGENQLPNEDDDDNFGEISSDKTNINSEKYPHTKAKIIQDAKFEFIKIDGEQIQSGNVPSPQQLEKEIRKRLEQQLAQQGQQQQTPEPKQAPERKQDAKQPTAPKAKEPAPQKEQPKAPTQKAPEQKQPEKPQKQEQPAQGLSAAESKVIELTNAERRKNGLPDLKADTSLSNVARKKSDDMQANNYFSHTSPTYGSPFDMMRDFGVSYNTAGENIAQGQQTPEQVVQAWMNSAGHRKNILSGDFTHIGVGYNQTGHHWTQMFIGK
jgi:uncharacterized YkwD family protein